jgi:hypothetical protein
MRSLIWLIRTRWRIRNSTVPARVWQGAYLEWQSEDYFTDAAWRAEQGDEVSSREAVHPWWWIESATLGFSPSTFAYSAWMPKNRIRNTLPPA